MPRKARQKSESNIYHIILRGINRQTIFESEQDYKKFLYALHRYKLVSSYKLFAYCLMSNHVHLLLKTEAEPLEQIMRRIGASFVYWYNKKNERVGNLFQDRFKSEPVENDSYFLTVLRYIHQNPLKAGLINNIGDYQWSSYNNYLNSGTYEINLLDLDFALNMFSNNSTKAIKAFADFHKHLKDDHCLDIEVGNRISDLEAVNIIKSKFKLKNAKDLREFAHKQRNDCIRELKLKHNLSNRQIERLTGINRGVIQRA